MITEVLDRLPTPDGGLRRRFTSGILYLLVIFVGVSWFPQVDGISQQFIEFFNKSFELQVLSSTGLLIIIFSIVFVIGNLLEVLSHVLLSRLFSLGGGTFAYRGIQASYDAIKGNGRPPINLTATERKTYDELPIFVRDGLSNPYDRQFEVAFRFLIHISPDDEKGWLERLDSKNQNLFSIISTVFFAMFTVLVLSVVYFQSDNSNNKNFVSTTVQSTFDLSEPSTKQCFKDALVRIGEFAGVEPKQIKSLSDKIQNNDVSIVANLKEVLDSTYVETRDDTSKQSELVNLVGVCQGLGYKKPVMGGSVDSLWLRIGMFVAVTLVMLVTLSVVYALMLRNSIASALEMLWLRLGIEIDTGSMFRHRDDNWQNERYSESSAPDEKS